MKIDKIFVLFLFIFLTGHFNLSGQKVVKSRGYCKIPIVRNISRAQAEADVIACAQKEAIANAFGTSITQEDIVRSNNVQTGNKATGSTSFQSFGTLEVKGEWIKTVSEPTIKIINGEKGGDDFIECEIVGEVRELKRKKAAFESYPLSSENDTKSRVNEFANDQFVYLYFRSPRKGFLNVYLDDGTNTFQLLPYKSSLLENVPVEADKIYVFFSRKKNEGVERVDEYRLNTEKESEQNVFHVMFSPRPFRKPILNNDNSKLSESDQRSGFTLPKYTSSPKFLNYLQELRLFDSDLELSSFPVLITNK